MSLQKTSADFNFSSGVDTLTDSTQLPLGKFVDLQNSVFIQNEGLGRLDKRFGFDLIASFSGARYLTTFHGNLLGVGNNVYAYSNSITATVGSYQPLKLSTLSLNRNFNGMNIVDSARAPNGFICYTYRPSVQNIYYVAVVDGDSGQQIMSPVQMTPLTGTQSYPARVFSLNNKFVVTFDGAVGSTNSNLYYQTIDQSTLALSNATLISSSYRPASSASFQISFDGQVANNTLYLAFASSVGNVQAASINSAFALNSNNIIASGNCDIMSVAIDTSSGTTVYASWVPTYNGTTAKTVAFDQNFTTRFSAQAVTASGGSGLVNIASGVVNGNLNTYLENARTYSYDANTPTNMISQYQTTIAGATSPANPLIRSVGLASKAFTIASQNCFLSIYSSPYQSTYFLHGTVGTSINTIGKIAYGNAFTQYALPSTPNSVLALPNANVLGSSCQIAYISNTQVSSLNKNTNVSSQNQVSALYTTIGGINVSTWNFSADATQSTEIGNNLHLNGGFLWMYDGVKPVEHNFHLYPDNIQVTTNSGSGGLVNDDYFYQVIYQWQDAQGNIHRSAPSVPVKVTTMGAGNSTNLINIPTPRVTARTVDNAIQVSVYRWSTQQQTYYRIQPPTVMTATALASDSIVMADSKANSQILGNEILYTNGGELENIGLPAVSALALFDTRLWALSSEDENLLYYGKPGVEAEPVDMSDLQTYFVPPNVSGVAIPGGVKCIFGMDDKLILFKRNAIIYINGIGPDATGASNGYSNPILITNGIGCSRPNSIVLVPQGLMFQSDKGIWLLGRDLSMNFIGKEVEKFNDCAVKSALNIPATNEARFTLSSSNQTLVYDYFAQQWNQLTNVPAISSAIYQSKHASIDNNGNVSLQSATGFTDNGVPTVMSWTTGWINLMGLQGYARAYRMYLLGKFMSPHTYTVGIAYDYNPQIVQTETINPYNSISSGSQVEQWQINFDTQQCQSFQLTFNEIASSTAGAGLSLSGVKLVFGAKKDFPRNLGIRNKV